MKTVQKNRNSSKKGLIISLLSILLIGIGAAAVYFLYYQPTKETQTVDTPQTNTVTPQEDDKSHQDSNDKQDFLDDQSNNNPDNTQPTNTGTSPTTATLSFSAKSTEDTVIITTNLSSTSSGTCKLTITGGPTTVTKSAQVIYSPEYSSCAGFSIAKSEINASTWTIKLDVSSPAGVQTKTITYSP